MDRGNKSEYNNIRKGFIMIYIGFSTKTNKLCAKILCKKYRHVAPILITKNKCIMYQFVRFNKVVLIPIKKRDLTVLQQYGWKFVKYACKFAPECAIKSKPINCVQFTKRACGIKNIKIQMPDSLLKHITQK